MIVCNQDEFRPDFLCWIAANWRIWTAFEHEALRMRARGFAHYSARTVWEVLRHHTALSEGPESDWKVNNNFAPDAARLFMRLHPDAADFFELRGRAAAATLA